MVWQYIMVEKLALQQKRWQVNLPVRAQRARLEQRWLITRQQSIK